jgi:multiple sugar transport system substrate-binding protein
MRRVSASLCFLLFVGVLVIAQASTAAEPIKLNFLEVMTSPARTAVLKDMIAKFEADHPNITINLISPPYEQADNKLTLMMNAR